MLRTSLNKKRALGLLLLVVILSLFFSLNRLPKLDAVGGDLDAVTAPEVQCFQGFCIDREPGSNLLSRWWVFSITYLRLVTVGMTFAFLVAGLTEALLFPGPYGGAGFSSRGMVRGTLKGFVIGPIMNLCSACIVPVSTAFRRRGAGIEGVIAMVQGSATMSIPALAMVFFVFTPLLGFSRLFLALIGALLIGPIVAKVVADANRPPALGPELAEPREEGEASGWGPVLIEGLRDWAKSSIGYLVRMAPVMIVAGFASGLVIQWISPDTVTRYLGNDVSGIAIAATVGILINVPLMFEIPLVALLLLLGMGTAPAATLLFTAAAGGPITFWGLAKVMPRRAIATFATATWVLGVVGGLGVLAIGTFIWDEGTNLRIGSVKAASTAGGAVAGSRGEVGGMPIFADVTAEAGVDFLHHQVPKEITAVGAAGAVFDFNDDGFQDIYVTDSVGPNALFRNNGDGTFTDVAAAAGVNDPGGRGNGSCAADYDNDGDRDLYVTNYGSSKLFVNNGDGTFTDLTASAGVGDSSLADRSAGCAWGDYDRDGHLDLIVVRYLDEWAESLGDIFRDVPRGLRGLALYHNNGDRTFSDATALLGDTSGPRDIEFGEAVGNIWGAGFQPGWVDFDNDGDLDLYVVNDFGQHIQPNVLWRNDGPAEGGTWSFVDVSKESGAGVPMSGMGLAIGDYNLDGFLDLFMTNIGPNVLLKNNGDGRTFTNTAVEAGAAITMPGLKDRFTWGALFFDYDNDGDEDLYVVSGFQEEYPGQFVGLGLNLELSTEQPNVLLRNDALGSFTDVSVPSGADDAGIGRGGIYLDFDNDGCLDLFVANIGQRAKLFRNLCESGNNWLIIDAVGTTSNRDGIGARIEVESVGTTHIRELSGGSSLMGQNMPGGHFGLGTATLAESVTVRWPSGKVQTLRDVIPNQRLTITEPP